LITVSSDAQGYGAAAGVVHAPPWAAVGFFSLALISLSRVLVFMPSLENFSFVLHFVFVLG
jgi:hypothetical protein